LEAHKDSGVTDADLVRESIHAAHRAVCERVAEAAGPDAPDDDTDPPGATIVVTIVRERQVTIGWLGDSRAYLLGPSPRLLTKDHSWKNEVERLGYDGDPSAMGNLGNALTRCIGPLETGMRSDVDPDVVSTSLEKGSTLVICSDGLWSYFPDAPLLDKLVAFHDDANEAELAIRLVNHALVAGGEDNVSVIVFRG
jgi:serine/threonine protein phosphatase PrpC